MKRWLAKLVVFLLLGAVVNLAVAWGCAAWSADEQIYDIEPYDERGYFNTVDDDLLAWLEERRWPITEDQIVTFGELATFGYYRRELFVLDRSRLPNFPQRASGGVGGGPGFPAEFLRHTYAGWPLLCLDGEEWIESYDRRVEWMRDGSGWNTQPYDTKWVRYVEVPVDEYGLGLMPMPRPIPFRPVWPGFAINTVFYAAILWLPTLGPFTARRMIRRKRGHCIKCGYDLRGTEHETCPECGLGRGVVEAVRRN